MGQILRITFEQQDYTIKLLSPIPPNSETTELKIELLNEARTLQLNANVWQLKHSHDLALNRLAGAIGKAICLHYRV